MSWGTSRRNTVIFLVIVVLIIPVIVGGFLIIYQKPNCFDGRQNSDETGIDCGGSCELVCTQETLDPVVEWERFFQVNEGVYNVVAYVENQNPNAGSRNVPYIFKLFNRDGVLIEQRNGSTRIRPKSVVPIIENGLRTLKQVPTRVSFEFSEDIIFEKENPQELSLIVKDEDFFIDNSPKVSATLQNITLESVEDISVIVLLFDTFDNVVATSSTFVEEVSAEGSKDVTFTWPNSLKEEVSRIEVIPIYE